MQDVALIVLSPEAIPKGNPPNSATTRNARGKPYIGKAEIADIHA